MSIRIKAVIFDMDGVIVDSELYWKNVEAEFLRGLIPEWNSEWQRQIIGTSVRDVHDLIVREFNVDITFEEYLEYYQSIANEIYGVRSNPIQNVEAVIMNVASQCPVAVTSSSPRNWIDIVVDRFSLREHLAAIVSADDIQGQSKPSPTIYLETAKRLEVEPRYCVAIEDTEKGVKSAIGAGMRCIAFRNGFNDHQDLTEATWELNSMRMVEDLLLDSLNSSIRG